MEKPRERDSEPACSSLGLCRICRQIFAPTGLSTAFKPEGIKHHTSQEDLMAAAEQGCYICRLMRDRLTDLNLQARSPTESGSATPLWFYYETGISTGKVELSFFRRSGKGSPTKLLNLMAYIPKYCKELAPNRPGQTTWSTALKERARQWLRDGSAEDTVSNQTPFLPKRLLHVRALEDDQYQVSLCEDYELPRGTQYLTLSHRWGQDKFLTLKKTNIGETNIGETNIEETNIEELKQGIQYQTLPKNFRDAIKITCDLDFNYLWIDSLCIIQGSEPDWLSQGLIMNQIYQNAACNISADVAEDSEAGLIRERDIETFLPLRLTVEWEETFSLIIRPEQRYVFMHEAWETVSGAPLANRAWVLQERLLSRKIIHFTTRQVFFESKDRRKGVSNFSEQWPNGVRSLYLNGTARDSIVVWWHEMTRPERQHEARWETWTEMVETYSQMRLTYEKDRLAALSGVIREVQRNTGDKYLAGLWKKDLLWQLLWHINPWHIDPTRSSHRTQDYTAPTWSWASVSTAVLHRVGSAYFSRRNLLCKVVDAKTSPMLNQGKNTGAINGGFLRLQGSLRQARLNHGDPTSKAQPYWTVGHSRKKILFLPDIISPGNSNISRRIPEHHSLFLEEVFNKWYSRKLPRFVQPTIEVHAPTQSVFLLPILSTANFSSGSSLRPNEFTTVGLALKPTDSVRGEFKRLGLFLTVHLSEIGSILHHPCDIEESYYEKKNRGRYTISII